MLWLAMGVVLGIGLWNLLPRWLPHALNKAPEAVVMSASDPQSVIKAMNGAHPGDIIEVPAGEFFGPIEFKDGVSLISQKPGATVLRADPAAVTDAGIAIAVRGVHKGRISGFKIVGDEKSTLATGLLLEDSAIEIDDTEISGATDCGVRMEGSPSILRANFIHDNPGCGVWIGGENAPRLAGNRISANGKAGVEVHPPAAPSIENNIITRNGAPDFGPVPAATADEFRRRNVME
jgi:parallel beta-helix repeat protein